MVRNDGPVSVARAFVARDWEGIAKHAGVPAHIRWHFTFCYSIAPSESFPADANQLTSLSVYLLLFPLISSRKHLDHQSTFFATTLLGADFWILVRPHRPRSPRTYRSHTGRFR